MLGHYTGVLCHEPPCLAGNPGNPACPVWFFVLIIPTHFVCLLIILVACVIHFVIPSSMWSDVVRVLILDSNFVVRVGALRENVEILSCFLISFVCGLMFPVVVSFLICQVTLAIFPGHA